MCYRKLKEFIKYKDVISRIENRFLDKWIESKII